MNQKSPGQKPQQQAQPPRSELMGPANLPIAYYNMPKAACTTIKNLLYYIQHGEWHHDPLAIHKEFKDKKLVLRHAEFLAHRQSKPFDRPFMTFTFIRNPGPRVYSAFVEKIWATGPYAFPVIRDILKATQQYNLAPLEQGGHSLEEVRAGFKQFLRFVIQNLEGGTKMAPNPHWICQYKRLQQLMPRDNVNFIGRVETFEEDMSFILRKAGWEDLSIAKKRFNEGPPPPFKLADVADEEIAGIFTRLYQKDYAAFDYEVVPGAPGLTGR